MTAYVSAASAVTLAVSPSSSFKVRIARIEAVGAAAAGGSNIVSYSAILYPSSTPTGGTTLTPIAMRNGSPAATATVKSGATVSGTNVLIHSEFNESIGTGTAVSMNSQYTFPFDLILASGSTLLLAPNAAVSVIVYFEELRDTWSF